MSVKKAMKVILETRFGSKRGTVMEIHRTGLSVWCEDGRSPHGGRMVFVQSCDVDLHVREEGVPSGIAFDSSRYHGSSTTTAGVQSGVTWDRFERRE